MCCPVTLTHTNFWVIGPNLQEKDEKADYGLQRDFTYRPLSVKRIIFFCEIGNVFFLFIFIIKNVFMTIFVMGVVKINEFNLELTIVNMSKSLSSNIKVALCDLQRPMRLYFIL